MNPKGTQLIVAIKGHAEVNLNVTELISCLKLSKFQGTQLMVAIKGYTEVNLKCYPIDILPYTDKPSKSQWNPIDGCHKGSYLGKPQCY